MAKCDEGYLCDICGQAVDAMEESDLYLRYILGQVGRQELARSPERHLRCNPAVAQFIVDADFSPVAIEGVFDKRELDTEYVQHEEARVTAAWRRLQILRREQIPLDEYPLATPHAPDVE